MSKEDEAVVRRIYELFGSGDIETLVGEMFAPNIVAHVPGKVVGGDKVGHAGMSQFFATLGSKADHLELDVHDVTSSDEHVVGVVTHFHRRGDKTLGMPAAHIWHIHDGKAMEMWELVRDTAAWDEFWA